MYVQCNYLIFKFHFIYIYFCIFPQRSGGKHSFLCEVNLLYNARSGAAAAKGCDMTTLNLFTERSLTVSTTPQLHLSHLQPFIRATRQESIHHSPAFTAHVPPSHIPYLDIFTPLTRFNHSSRSRSLSSVFSFFVLSHFSVVLAFKGFFCLPPFPAVFDSSLRISEDQGF